jgi:hypothetical protein
LAAGFSSGYAATGIEFSQAGKFERSGREYSQYCFECGFFSAAEAGESVMMKHLLVTAISECAKLERALSDSEIAYWV